MQKVAIAENPMHAHLIVAMLEEQGIDAIVQGEALWGARGELPLTAESAPSVWVADEAQAARARQLIAENEVRTAAHACPSCGHEVRPMIEDSCPGCGTPLRPRADRACPICGEPMEVPFVRCWKCAAKGPIDATGTGAADFAAPSGPSLDELARRARSDCRRCAGAGIETRILLPAALFFTAALCWLAAATGVSLERFPDIRWARLPFATVQVMAGVVAVVVAFKYRYRACACTRRPESLDEPA
ncbi:MAG: hypothetical protein DCC65_13135 [Planctomycetota bacterium]|nr:MAG: hypothetical protein DCC65_13135 [Planctomycetota bacterium]